MAKVKEEYAKLDAKAVAISFGFVVALMVAAVALIAMVFQGYAEGFIRTMGSLFPGYSAGEGRIGWICKFIFGGWRHRLYLCAGCEPS